MGDQHGWLLISHGCGWIRQPQGGACTGDDVWVREACVAQRWGAVCLHGDLEMLDQEKDLPPRRAQDPWCMDLEAPAVAPAIRAWHRHAQQNLEIAAPRSTWKPCSMVARLLMISLQERGRCILRASSARCVVPWWRGPRLFRVRNHRLGTTIPR